AGGRSIAPPCCILLAPVVEAGADRERRLAWLAEPRCDLRLASVRDAAHGLAVGHADHGERNRPIRGRDHRLMAVPLDNDKHPILLRWRCSWLRRSLGIGSKNQAKAEARKSGIDASWLRCKSTNLWRSRDVIEYVRPGTCHAAPWSVVR